MMIWGEEEQRSSNQPHMLAWRSFQGPQSYWGAKGWQPSTIPLLGTLKPGKRRSKSRSKAPALVFPNVSSQLSCPKSISAHVCAGAEKGWLEGRQHSSGCRDLGSLTPQVSSD